MASLRIPPYVQELVMAPRRPFDDLPPPDSRDLEFTDCDRCGSAAQVVFTTVAFDEWGVPGVVELQLCYHHGNRLEPVLRGWDKPSPDWRAVGRWMVLADRRKAFATSERPAKS
jgi:hypothetical protein